MGLERPFDGTDAEAEPVTYEYLGRVFEFVRDLRRYGRQLGEEAALIEKVTFELRDAQEEVGDLDARYRAYIRATAPQWQAQAENAAERLRDAEAREVSS